jgi:excinuclease UvrABC nuclease subunit|tara:strand:+ start:934 stop:1509 length:576 start_codon:yes stop_codon:yes gene_type:complete
MINTKNINNKDMGLTPAQRKQKVAKLKEEHQDYFDIHSNNNVLYIPKMAYRPSGKDDLHVSFFPSELEKEEDVYTEFVSIDYDSEDPKRTLYLHKYNPHWKEEYELITSNSGFQRHLIPVSELKVINDVTGRGFDKQTALEEGLDHKDEPQLHLFDIADPDATPSSDIVNKLDEINQSLITLTKVINKLIK